MKDHIPFPTTPSQSESDEITRECRRLVDEAATKSMKEKYKSKQ